MPAWRRRATTDSSSASDGTMSRTWNTSYGKTLYCTTWYRIPANHRTYLAQNLVQTSVRDLLITFSQPLHCLCTSMGSPLIICKVERLENALSDCNWERLEVSTTYVPIVLSDAFQPTDELHGPFVLWYAFRTPTYKRT
jgi:hypothetical protein